MSVNPLKTYHVSKPTRTRYIQSNMKKFWLDKLFSTICTVYPFRADLTITSQRNGKTKLKLEAANSTQRRFGYIRSLKYHLVVMLGARIDVVEQGWGTLILEGRVPAEFSSNPNQTHLKQLIKVFRMQLGCFFSQGFSGLELNSAGEWPSRINVPHPCCRGSKLKF